MNAALYLLSAPPLAGERSEIARGLQGKMIQLGFPFQPLQVDKAAESGKEGIGLSRDGLRGGLGQRDVLVERRMTPLHFPSCRIDRGPLVHRHGGLAGDQREHPLVAVLVCEDWLDEQEREGSPFEIDEPGGVGFQA